jgi:aerobic carbon-monoxide dehydrogenase medium subunit
MKLPPFEYRCPESLAEAASILAANPGAARPLAGGQTLLPMMAFRLAEPAILVDLRKVPALDRISVEGDEVRIGAMVRWRDIEESAALYEACPILREAMSHVAHYQIRNCGTVGGSLAHGDPASEMPGLAILCDARIDVISCTGTRTIPAGLFFRSPLTTALGEDELITSVCFKPWPKTRRWAFEEFAMRKGDFALAAIGLCYDENEAGYITDVRIAVIGATDIPRRLVLAERTLKGQHIEEETIAAAATAASKEVSPPEHFQASIAYRRALVATLVERGLHHAAGEVP